MTQSPRAGRIAADPGGNAGVFTSMERILRTGWRVLALTACIAGALASSRPAAADIPWAGTSTFDSCLVWCPGGDAVYHLTARKLSGTPFNQGDAVFELTNCPGFHLCPFNGSEAYDYFDNGSYRSVRE